MRKNGVLSYLHGDHLGSTVLTSNSSGAFSGQDLRYGYGRFRGGTELGTAPSGHPRFTAPRGPPKLDGAGLMYFNARYYDPDLGQFLSPDTLVPDLKNLFDYNRYMYSRGNPMKYNDPTGHEPCYTKDITICRGPGDEEKFILQRAGVTSSNADKAEVVSHAVYDLSNQVGGLDDLNTLLNGETGKTTNVNVQTSNLMQQSGRVGEPYTGCTYDACEPTSDGSIVYADGDYNKTKSVVVHELGHVIDEQTSVKGCWIFCSLSGQYPEETGSTSLYTSPSGNILNPVKENFAKGVATWVYGEKTLAGQAYPLTKEQAEFLNSELRGRQ